MNGYGMPRDTRFEKFDNWPGKPNRILEAHATDHDKIVVKGSNRMAFYIGNQFFILTADETVSLSAKLDTGTVQAGKDYYLYAVIVDGARDWRFSLNSTYPTGFTADNSRKIGGLHTLCANAGTLSGNALSGYVAGYILPGTVWDLKFRTENLDNRGMTYAKSINKWVQIYLASDDGAGGVQSVYGATILDTLNWDNFAVKARKSRVKFLTDFEYDCILETGNQKTNIQGSADPVTTGGHVDTAGRRILTEEEIEDGAGVLHQWTDTHGYHFAGAAAHTHQVTVSGDAQTVTSGNPSGDVAPSWGYRDLGDNRGSFYGQGTYGETKLLAGGYWNSGAICGSRYRSADVRRSVTGSSLGARFACKSL